MNEKVLKSLYDINIAIEEIENFFIGRKKNFKEYSRNILLKRALERNLGIIGEAVNRILREEPEFPLENAKRIIGLRNQIIHGYDNVSDEIIWGIVVKYLPKLKAEVHGMIKKSL